METSLHRELKRQYAEAPPSGARPKRGRKRLASEKAIAEIGAAEECAAESGIEIRLADYRIDAIVAGELIEIQLASLAALRRKAPSLLQSRRLRIVKPIIRRKWLVKRSSRTGPVEDRRLSPKQGRPLDLFEELVYFTKIFPHPRLSIEWILVDVEEWRYPGHGRRRRYRERDFVVEDVLLRETGERGELRTPDDLIGLLGVSLEGEFDTAKLALELGERRHIAQRIAYCLRETGAIQLVGKSGNSLIYRRSPPVRQKRRKIA